MCVIFYAAESLWRTTIDFVPLRETDTQRCCCLPFLRWGQGIMYVYKNIITEDISTIVLNYSYNIRNIVAT